MKFEQVLSREIKEVTDAEIPHASANATTVEKYYKDFDNYGSLVYTKKEYTTASNALELYKRPHMRLQFDKGLLLHD